MSRNQEMEHIEDRASFQGTFTTRNLYKKAMRPKEYLLTNIG